MIGPEEIRERLKSAISYDVALSIDGHPELTRGYRTDVDAQQLLDALVPIVTVLLEEAESPRPGRPRWLLQAEHFRSRERGGVVFPRVHFAHPGEHVPWCMVSETFVDIGDVECWATRRPDEVTCRECQREYVLDRVVRARELEASLMGGHHAPALLARYLAEQGYGRVMTPTENVPDEVQPATTTETTEVSVEMPAKVTETTEVVETAETAGPAEPDAVTEKLDVSDDE